MTKKSRPTIAFLTHSISDAYGARLWAGAMEAAKEGNANLICYPGCAPGSPRGFEAQANTIYDFITAESVDGVVLSGGVFSEFVGKKELEKFCERYRPLPMVSIAVALKGIPSVLAEDYQGMSEVMSHLIGKHNIHRIAFLTKPMKNPQARLRYDAYIDALAKHGLTLDSRLVAREAEWREDTGRNAIRWLLDEQKLVIPDDFRAIVAGNDELAYGALVELQSRAIRVPEDVVITGFDAEKRSRYFTPPLTTVRQPIFEQARWAINAVLAQLRGEGKPKNVSLPTELVVRQSCGCSNQVVEQAKAGMATRAGTVPKMALTASRDGILSEMVEEVVDSSTGNVTEKAERLLNAFYADLKGGSSGTFLSTLDETLQLVALDGCDVSAWQGTISVIRRSALPYIVDDQALYHVENLWQQARVMIGERAQQAQGYRKLQSEQRTAILGSISQALVSTSDEKELMTILADGLPKLGIPSCYISRYENPVVPTEWCQNILAYEDGRRVDVEKDRQRFLSWQLVPGDLLPQNRLYSLVVEPLYFRENQIGIAVFEVGPREGIVYETLRGQLSSALWGARLVQYLRSLYEASSSVMSLLEPQDILQDVADRACKAVGARSAIVALVNKDGQPKRLATGGDRSIAITTSSLIGTAGIAVQVMQSNEPYFIQDMQSQVDLTNRQMIEASVGAAGCFPMRLRGKPIGVMWVYYERPHLFPGAEKDALGLYVNQAAIAYDNGRRMKELEHLRQASEKLAKASEIREVLQQIVQSAREVLQADSAVIWSYDAARMAFNSKELAAEGVPTLVLERYREDKPRPDGTAAIVIQKGYLAVTDVNDLEHAYLKPPGRGLREVIGVKSFQGIVLQADGEPLGVLYVNYKSPQVFGDGDKSTLEAFSYHAALALKKARLLEQVRRAHDATRSVAELSIREDLQNTLDKVIRKTCEVLRCDAVVLFVYDQVADRLDHPPIMVGVRFPERASSAGEVLQDSLVYKLLRRDEPYYIVEVVAQDPLFQDRRFARDEQIESCVAIPLRTTGQRVGVMFVNYRMCHRFTSEELADIELFAHQAAVAILNSQLRDKATRKTIYLRTLYEVGKAVTSTLALDEILNRIAEQAWIFTGYHGKPARFSDIALVEGNKWSVRATHPLEYLPKIRTRLGDLNLDSDVGITGRAVKTGQSQLVGDVRENSDYTAADPETCSELAVPIRIGSKVIGVINVEAPELYVFDDEDQQVLEALAAQAAIAIQNVQNYEELKRTNEELKRTQVMVGARTALAWIGMTSSAWRHTIDRYARNIGEQIDPLRKELGRVLPINSHPRIAESLSRIQRLAYQIRQKPITPPLSDEEATRSVAINGLIRERTKQLWENEPYKSVTLHLDLTLDDEATVRASPEWLRRAADVLIDNAVDAMANFPRRQVTIVTRQKEAQVEILVRDTGGGIPEEVQPELIYKPIKRPKGAKGLGMGLLMAQAIVQTYGGEIRVESTGPTGTTMLVCLPLEV